ncbi:MAG: hypothetical protein WCK02_01470 [Bacteroidota bacterium]
MKINKDNYPSYFLDYMDGTISKSDLNDLYSFVYQDPKLIQEFESLDLFTIENDLDDVFEEKQALKKIDFSNDLINEKNIELFVIAYFENDLNSFKKNELEKFLNNNKSYIPLFEAYKNTFLAPEIIEFENKEQLKHYSPKRIRPLYYYLSAAASIALIISMYFLMPNKNNQTEFSEIKSLLSPKHNKTKLIHRDQNQEAQLVSSSSEKLKTVEKKKFLKKELRNNKHLYEKMTSISANLILIKNENAALTKIKSPDQVFTQEYTSKNEPVTLAYSDNSYPTVSEYLVGKVNNYLGTDIPKNKKSKEKIRIWDIAEWGSKAVNKIFDKKTEVAHKYDENGKLSYLSLKMGKIAYVKNN